MTAERCEPTKLDKGGYREKGASREKAKKKTRKWARTARGKAIPHDTLVMYKWEEASLSIQKGGTISGKK